MRCVIPVQFYQVEVAMSGKALFVFLLTLCWLGLTPAVASAHSVVVLRSEPETGAVLQQAPNQIAVMFNEELDSHASTLQVFSAEGQQVDVGDGGVDLTDPDHASMIVHLPALEQDGYVVRWHVVLDDGDASEGFLTFTVGAGTARPAPVSVPALNTGLSSRIGWMSVGVALLLAMGASGLLWRRRVA